MKLNLRIEDDSLALVDGDASVLVNLFADHFDEVQVRFQHEDDERYTKYRKKCPYPILSMDPLYRGEYNLGISRLYRDKGKTFIGHYSRPETEMSLLEQFRAIPKGIKVVIFEDDIGYGGQIRRVKRILSRMGVEVVDIFTLFDNTEMKDEVLDMRDFIVDAPFGGLVMEASGEKVRVPYLHPFVDVKERCSIEDGLEFSIKMWEFNASIAKTEEAKTYCNLMTGMCRRANV